VLRSLNTTARIFRKRAEKLEACYLFAKEPVVTWVNVIGIQQVEVLESWGAASSCIPWPWKTSSTRNSDPRSRITGDLFIVVKLISYNEKKDEVEAEQISLILRPNALLSFQEREGDDFAGVKERLRGGKGAFGKWVPTTWPTPFWISW